MIPTMTCDRQSPYRVEGQVQAYCGIGLCDPALANSLIGMVPVVYDSVAFQATIPENNDNISFATAQDRSIFESTTGAIMDGAWYPKTLAETNTLRDGELSRRGQQFIAFGFAAEAPEVFQRGGDGDAATDPKLKSAWLAPAGDGMNYAAQAKQTVLENVAGLITIVDTGNTQRVLPLSFLPHWGQTRGQGMTQNGGLSVIQFLANNVALCIGTETDGQEIQILLRFGQATDIESGSTATVAGTLYVWVRFSAFGIPCCMPVGTVCGIPTLDGGMAAPGTPPAGRSY